MVDYAIDFMQHLVTVLDDVVASAAEIKLHEGSLMVGPGVRAKGRRRRAKLKQSFATADDLEQGRYSTLLVAAANWEADLCEFPSDMETGWFLISWQRGTAPLGPAVSAAQACPGQLWRCCL